MRPRGRATGTAGLAGRGTAVLLALSLGLNAVGHCLCGPEPVRAAAPHACCASAAAARGDTAATGTLLQAVETPCCRPHATEAVAERVAGREASKQALVAAAATPGPARVLPSPTSSRAARSPSFLFSPPETVLRV